MRKQSSVEIRESAIEPEMLMTKEIERVESFDRAGREKDIRQGIDLATTLERIEKNFVITDPRLPDNPIVRSAPEQTEFCIFDTFLVYSCINIKHVEIFASYDAKY